MGDAATMPLRNFSTGAVNFTVGNYTSPAAWWGNDLFNNSVSNFTAFQGAIRVLRSPLGRSPASNFSFSCPNPVQWTALDLALGMMDSDVPQGGGAAQTVEALQVVGIEPILVVSINCGQFSFNTTNASSPQYWAERWELYKIHYMSARWAYRQGIRKMEFWCARGPCARVHRLGPPARRPGRPLRSPPRSGTHNLCVRTLPAAHTPLSDTLAAPSSCRRRQEPDTASCITNVTWVETYTLSAQAIQNAFADANADVASGALACGVPANFSFSCPMAPIIMASAFYFEPMSGTRPNGATNLPPGSAYTYYGNATVANAFTQFPPFQPSLWNPNVSVTNMNAYSLHLYGKPGGLALNQSVASIASNIASILPPGVPAFPVVVTEVGNHLPSDWNNASSALASSANPDSPFEASRLASQARRRGSCRTVGP